MATLNARSKRQSYLLTVEPINYSLTAGTNIPPPPEEDFAAPPLAAPPVADGGPLTSHPTTPDDKAMPGAWPADSSPGAHASRLASKSSVPPNTRNDSCRTSSPPEHSQQRPSTAASGVRRLFSISNLRSSFSSSRTSLMLPRESNESTFFDSNATHSVKRPTSPSVASSYGSYNRPSATQSSRSRNWFKRKSSMLQISDPAALASVDEDRRPETRDSKRQKPDVSGAPLLPEVGTLGGGGALNDGEIGWDSSLFKQ